MFPDAFHTDRLFLRPIVPSDAEAIFMAYAQDGEVTRFLTWRPYARAEDVRDFIQDCIGSTSSRTYVLLQGDVLVGATDLRREKPHAVGFGYVLARQAWGQGLMTEALTAMRRWALDQPAIWRFGASCDVENVASARVMEKAGLDREGVACRWLVHPNLGDEPRDCFIYAAVR